MLRSLAVAVGGLIACLLLLATALLLWPRSGAPLPEARQAYVIQGSRVIDVIAGTAGPPTSVVVRDGVITEISSRVVTDGLIRIDGRGRFLVPGFWDMHVHTFRLSPQADFPLWIANGVTSVRDMMDCPQLSDSLMACISDERSWNAEVAAGRLTAPRIVESASYYLEDPALTPAAVSSKVREYQARGIAAIKVYNRLQPAAYFRAAGEARRRKIRLVGHLPKSVSLEEATFAGQTSFEHAHLFARACFRRASEWRAGKLDHLTPTRFVEALVAEHDPRACRIAFSQVRKAGAWYVPTHVTREQDARAGDPSFSRDPSLSYLDPLSRWAYRKDLAETRAAYPNARGELALRAYFDFGLRLTRQAHEAGVNVLVGTDTAVGGVRYHDELAHFSRAGLSPAEVLRAATINAARYARLEETSGSVDVGKRADLVLLDANPLADVTNMRRIHAVLLDGRLYDSSRLNALHEFARSQATALHLWVKLLWGFARSSVISEL